MSVFMRTVYFFGIGMYFIACTAQKVEPEGEVGEWIDAAELKFKNVALSSDVSVEGDCLSDCAVLTTFKAGEDEIVIKDAFIGGIDYFDRETYYTINGVEGYETNPNTHFLSVTTQADKSSGDLISNQYFYAAGVYMIDGNARYALGRFDYEAYELVQGHQGQFEMMRETLSTKLKFSEVDWFYVTASREGPGELHGNDGVIEVDGDVWRADFNEGMIQIDGTINGTVMTGNMTAFVDDRELRGGTLGEVGEIAGETQTAGTFAGGSISEFQSIAGGWMGTGGIEP